MIRRYPTVGRRAHHKDRSLASPAAIRTCTVAVHIIFSSGPSRVVCQESPRNRPGIKRTRWTVEQRLTRADNVCGCHQSVCLSPLVLGSMIGTHTLLHSGRQPAGVIPAMQDNHQHMVIAHAGMLAHDPCRNSNRRGPLLMRGCWCMACRHMCPAHVMCAVFKHVPCHQAL